MHRGVEFRRQRPHIFLHTLRRRRRPGRQHAALDDESVHDPMERRAVVGSERRKPQEIPDVHRRDVGRESQA